MADHIAVPTDATPPWSVDPGSPEAASEGCTCSQARNKFGKGVSKHHERRWYPDPFCSVHGLMVAKRTGKPKDVKVVTKTIAARERRRRHPG